LPPYSLRGIWCFLRFPSSLKMSCSLGKEGKSSVGCSFVQGPRISMTLIGHYVSRFLFLHRGHKIAKVAFSSSCFLLIFMVSNFVLIVFRISILNFSSRFHNSILVTTPRPGLVVILIGSLKHFPLLVWFIEYLLQYSAMSVNDFWYTSPKLIRFSTSIQSSLIPFRKMVLTVVVSKENCFVF